MSFLEDNATFLKSYIRDNLIKIKSENVERIIKQPILLHHSKNHNLSLRVLVTTNPDFEEILLDAIAFTLTRMGWPRQNSSDEFVLVFNKLMNQQ